MWVPNIEKSGFWKRNIINLSCHFRHTEDYANTHVQTAGAEQLWFTYSYSNYWPLSFRGVRPPCSPPPLTSRHLTCTLSRTKCFLCAQSTVGKRCSSLIALFLYCVQAITSCDKTSPTHQTFRLLTFKCTNNGRGYAIRLWGWEVQRQPWDERAVWERRLHHCQVSLRIQSEPARPQAVKQNALCAWLNATVHPGLIMDTWPFMLGHSCCVIYICWKCTFTSRSLLSKEELSHLRSALEHDRGILQHSYAVNDGHGRNSRLCIWSHPGSDVTGMVGRCEKVAGTMEQV